MTYSKEALENFTRNYLASLDSATEPPALNPLQRRTFQAPSYTTGGWSPPTPPVVDQGGPSTFSRISDILSRPLYGAAGGVGELFKWARGDDAADPGHAVAQGITGKEKKTYGDVLQELDPQNPNANRWFGLAADLVLDPLNAVPASWISAPLKMGAKGVAMTTKVGREAHRSAKTLREAEKTAAAERAASAGDETVTDISSKSTDAGEVPEEDAQDLITQIVGKQKDEENPFTAPSPADTKPTEEIPLPPEPPEEDFFPDFATPTTPKPTATPTAPTNPTVPGSREDFFAKYAADIKAGKKPPTMTQWTAMDKEPTDALISLWEKEFGKAPTTDELGDLFHNYKAAGEPASAAAQAAQAAVPPIVTPKVKPEPPVPPDIAAQLAEDQARRDAVDGAELTQRQERLTKNLADPNPSAEVLKQIDEDKKAIEFINKLRGEKPSIVDEITTEKIPEAEAKPPISEEVLAEHGEQIAKGEVHDIGNLKQSEEMNKSIVNARRYSKEGTFAERQASAMDRAVGDFAKQAEAARATGSEPFVEAANGRNYTISMDQAIDALAKNGHAEAVSRGLFNTAHEVGPHAFTAGLAEVLRHADEGTGILRDQVVDNIVDAMNNATTENYRILHRTHKSAFVKNTWEGNTVIAQRELAEAMVDSIDDLVDIASSNKARYSKRVAEETEKLTNVTNQRVAEAMKPETSASEAAELVNDIPKAEKAAADEIKATADARVNASVGSVKSVTDAGIDAKSTEAAAKKAKGNAEGNQKAVEDASKAEAKRAVEDFDEIGKKSQPDYVHDVDVQNAVQMEGIIERITNWFGTKFLPNYGAAQLADFWRLNKSFNSSTAARFGKTLNGLAKEYKPSDIKDAWQILRDTTKTKAPAGLTPEMTELVKKLNVAAGAIYDFRGMKDSAFFTSFMQIGLDLKKPESWDVINRALARRGIGHRFKTMKDDKSLTRTQVASQYLDWDVENPLEFLHNSFEALRDLATNKAIVDHMINKWGVTTPREGYVRMASSKGTSDLVDFFPTKTQYYIPKEAAEQMQNLEKIMKASTNFKGQKGAFARFMNDTVDPMIQMWKTLVTIVRPSHHMRNLVGDMSASWLDGVYGQAPYRKSMGMLISQRQKKTFEEQVRQIQGLISPLELKQITNPKFTVKLANGKVQQLDSVMMNRLAYQSGVLPLFTSIEDIMSESSRGLGRVSKGLMESKPIKFMGNISEKTSHLGRLSHWIALMERGHFTNKFSSLEDAAHAASKRMRKFHPDSSGLTAFEQKYMRRIFPFYSWFRQAVPTFAARLVTKPARINDLNKVQYEFASAMGVDPQSLSDPFPEDQEFPSWLRASPTGPWTKGGLMMNFGTPIETLTGLANETPESSQGGSGNPQILEQILNMLNPAIKAPIELTGGSMVTNRPVSDPSEYVDSMIPGASTVGTAFGSWSPSGTVQNILTGQSTGGPGPIDPMRSTLRDGNNRWLNQSLLNFLVGISAKNAYSPTAQKGANIERLTRVNGGG